MDYKSPQTRPGGNTVTDLSSIIAPAKRFTVPLDWLQARRGNRYKLYLPGCKPAARYNFFSYRVLRACGTLPAGKNTFQSINGFTASLTHSLLMYQCRLYFACVFICVYVCVLFCIAVFAVLSPYLLST